MTFAFKPSSPSLQTLLAPAKLNLFLQVFSTKIKNYHQLQSLMVPISLYDVITIGTTSANFPTVKYSINNSLPNSAELAKDLKENCIAKKTLEIVRSQIDSEPLPLEIHIEKNIPIQAGLGGGSSDAATILLAVNNMLKQPLSAQALLEIATSIGADVPFFCARYAALVAGYGQIVFPVSVPQKWFVLIATNVEISTEYAFKELITFSPSDQKYKISHLFNSRFKSKLKEDSQAIGFGEKALINDALKQMTAQELSYQFPTLFSNGENSFKDKLLTMNSKLKQISEHVDLSCDLPCRITGTGGALFCECNDQKQAEFVLKKAEKMFATNAIDAVAYMVRSI